MTPRPQRTADGPRVCRECGARLSAYNRNDTCWTHTVPLPWQGPNTRPR